MHNMRFLRRKAQDFEAPQGTEPPRQNHELSSEFDLSNAPEPDAGQPAFLNLAWRKARTATYGDHHNVAAEFKRESFREGVRSWVFILNSSVFPARLAVLTVEELSCDK